MFDKPGLFYSNNPFDVFDNNWMLDYQKINSLKQHKLSVLDFGSEHYGIDGIDHVYHALESSGVNFLLLSHDPNDHQKFKRMFFYPHWYHWSRKNFKLGENNPVKKYKWSCLNGNPRTHRIYNYFYSLQQPYFDSAYFTFHNDDFFSGERPGDVILSEDVINFWNSIKNSVPKRSEINGNHKQPKAEVRCDLPANTETYIHLVTETTVITKVFVTEKTWKPIASGQLFLIFGNPGTIQHLRNQGVDVFDDVINHSYDLIEDWQYRLHLIHKELKLLLEKNLQDIYTDTIKRRQANVEKFFAGAFDTQYQQSIQNALTNYYDMKD